jgi:hypothetical protein
MSGCATRFCRFGVFAIRTIKADRKAVIGRYLKVPGTRN